MALSQHEYDEPSEYRQCEKCRDTFHVDEVDWELVQGFMICEYCIGSFISELLDEKKD